AYTGQERDGETGLQRHGLRYYAPWLGRWASADPAGMVDGPNLYRYASNAPNNYVDPGGTESIWDDITETASETYDYVFGDDEAESTPSDDAESSLWEEASDYLQNSEPAQFITGAVTGALAGLAPGGFTVGIAGEASGASEEFPQAFKFGYGAGETVVGFAQIIAGLGGEVAGGALVIGGTGATGTGVGAPVGVPAVAGGAITISASTVAIVEGAADVSTGLTIALSAVFGEGGGSGGSGGGGGGGGGKAPESFENQLPENLENELAAAESVGAGPIRPETELFETALNQGTIKFVVTEGGELLISPHTVNGVEISHSVLSGGRPVLTAGQADIAASGGHYVGIGITNHSGHFKPSLESLKLAEEAFRALGITF
ncbi:MAG: RHS repeat-associated core domain-containing protein, partial [Pseudomonadota bacterium]